MLRVKEFDLLTLHNALIETFNNRETSIEKRNSIFNAKFKNDKNLEALWTAFIKKRSLKINLNFSETVSKIELFIEPACIKTNLTKTWNSKSWIWE